MDETLESGTLLAGRYCIKRVIAAGGMGAVYDAIDERFGRPVAVKVVLKELAADARLVARFEREAGAVARLSHPSIVHVHDYGATDDGVSYLVMERVSGTNLADLLSKEGTLAPERAADLVEQALGALEVAHEAGIVHRDLKPANLMVVPAGASRELVKILDFGVAQLMTGEAYARLTRTGSLVGTPAFMSPEQARGEPTDARSDLYAMGVTLYCLLTGKRPFEGGDLAEILRKVRTEPAMRADVRKPGVPLELAKIADRAMEKDPARRYASAHDMAKALVAWRTARSSGAPASAPSPPSARELPTMVDKRSGAPTVPMPATAAPPSPVLAPGPDAPKTPSDDRPRAWARGLSWLALATLIAACLLATVGAVLTAIFVPRAWWSGLGMSVDDDEPPPLVAVELGGSSGACNVAYACCDAFRRAIDSEAACETIHGYDQSPRQLCDQVRDTYRQSLQRQGYDASMCDP